MQNTSTHTQKDLCIHGSIHGRQQLETIQVSLKKWMNEQIVILLQCDTAQQSKWKNYFHRHCYAK